MHKKERKPDTTSKSSEIKCAEKRNDTISHMEVLLLLISMKAMTDKSLLLLLAFFIPRITNISAALIKERGGKKYIMATVHSFSPPPFVLCGSWVILSIVATNEAGPGSGENWRRSTKSWKAWQLVGRGS